MIHYSDGVKFKTFKFHPFECKHKFLFSAFRKLVCVKCGTVEDISYFAVSFGNNNDVTGKILFKATISLLHDYVENTLIGKENIDKWEDLGDSYINYHNEEYNNIIIDDLEIEDITSNINDINENIEYYESYYNGFINLIDNSHKYKNVIIEEKN